MRKYQPVDGNATIELREQLFQEVKQRALSLINKAQKENSVYALADLSADLSDLNKKYTDRRRSIKPSDPARQLSSGDDQDKPGSEYRLGPRRIGEK